MINRVEERLLDWAVQVIGNMARQYKSPLAAIMENGIASESAGKGSSILIDEEPMEVEEAVRKLPEVLRQVVKVQYLREGLSARGKARAAGVSVSTYYRHLDAAHVLLDVELFGARGPRVA
ncbi:hypothetical protein [Microbulbifer variabilis]|uniref:hypothetical protein n=1 Tax=Microbulbifer variabilis TaxID=266805 RepID=UPI001CFD456C|nr:hypothetical protein [Microbulbifer variabilis]